MPHSYVSVSGIRDGSVQSEASSSPCEQNQLGQSHPGYPLGPQVCGIKHYTLHVLSLREGTPWLHYFIKTCAIKQTFWRLCFAHFFLAKFPFDLMWEM